MSAALFISAVSVAIALASFVVNLWLNQRAAVRARKPVLVFVDDPEQECWVLRNVGNGPALNVLVAQRHEGRWLNPVLVPPFGTDSSFPLKWLGRFNTSGLGASYSDFEDRRYTSTLGGERSRAYERDRLPRWEDGEIRRYWELGNELVSLRWGRRRAVSERDAGSAPDRQSHSASSPPFVGLNPNESKQKARGRHGRPRHAHVRPTTAAHRGA